jgi:hypothetical protein
MSSLAELWNKQEELDEELKPFIQRVEISEGNYFDALKHPLVFQVPYHTQMNALSNAQLKAKREAIEEARKEKNYSQMIGLYERPYRLMAFSGLSLLLKDKEYWDLLSSVWIDSENIWQNLNDWKFLLGSKRKFRSSFMSEEDRKFLAELPKDVTVYRGYQPGLNKEGLSYTLDKDRAKWFSKRFSKTGEVAVRTVKRNKIFAYLSSRNEQEIILLN